MTSSCVVSPSGFSVRRGSVLIVTTVTSAGWIPSCSAVVYWYTRKVQGRCQQWALLSTSKILLPQPSLPVLPISTPHYVVRRDPSCSIPLGLGHRTSVCAPPSGPRPPTHLLEIGSKRGSLRVARDLVFAETEVLPVIAAPELSHVLAAQMQRYRLRRGQSAPPTCCC
jgi:hypothetical protein